MYVIFLFVYYGLWLFFLITLLLISFVLNRYFLEYHLNSLIIFYVFELFFSASLLSIIKLLFTTTLFRIY